MTKIRLFYSYSHKDESYRKTLEIHLATLRNDDLIDEWYDREISAGDDWDEEIERNMEKSDIILLLFSQDFIASRSCQKEVETAMKLKNKKGVIFIPIILRTCAWKDVDGISNIQALPEYGNPIKQWDDQDEAWQSVYAGIKKKVEEIRHETVPKLKNEFKYKLLKNPIIDCSLDKLFVYPDILEVDKSDQKLENNEIDSIKLTDIIGFKHKYILIEGKEQSGKTSLCNMLYLHYVSTGFYPILINGKDVVGRADIKNIIEEAYKRQYDSTKEYFLLDNKKLILIIDDLNERNVNNKNYTIFIESINNYFEYSVVFIDELSNLSDKSTENNYLYYFHNYVIKSLGYKKRDELIRRCIANDENTCFSIENKDQVARLDKDTKHINSIIGSNIFPSYPFFVVSAFNIVESITPQDMHHTSYGHCYHAMITTQLYRKNVKPESIEQYFNFITELSYYMFNNNKKHMNTNELNDFLEKYKAVFIYDNKIIINLVDANILKNKNEIYSFQYIYIYYYFVARYISFNIDDGYIKNQVDNLMSNIHKKDNYNIVIFITHHTNNNNLIDDILLYTMSTFEGFSEATLEKTETIFISEAINRLRDLTAIPDNHDVGKLRDDNLKEKDKVQPIIEQLEDEADDDDLLLIEIRKSAKSMEIIGQIMKNQYGSFTKDKLSELFENGQNVGLRLLKGFIDLMNNDPYIFDDFIQTRLVQTAKENNKELSKEKAMLISQKFVTRFSYGVIFGWLHKIVDSLGYDKLIDIADHVDNKNNTTASKLINFSIHAWYNKEIDTDVLKVLYKEFEIDKNHTAIHILKDIVSRHIYMHKVGFQDKQKINHILGFSMHKQIAIQRKVS